MAENDEGAVHSRALQPSHHGFRTAASTLQPPQRQRHADVDVQMLLMQLSAVADRVVWCSQLPTDSLAKLQSALHCAAAGVKCALSERAASSSSIDAH